MGDSLDDAETTSIVKSLSYKHGLFKYECKKCNNNYDEGSYPCPFCKEGAYTTPMELAEHLDFDH